MRGASLDARPTPDHIPQQLEDASVPGRWVDAGDLLAGDIVLLRDGRQLPIEQLALRAANLAVYNLCVADLHCYAVGEQQVLVHNNSGENASRSARQSAALEGKMITRRIDKAGQSLDDLYEFANPTLASRQGLGFVEEGHHFWPKWLGGSESGPLVNVRMGIHRGAGVGMHQRLNDHLVNSGLIPRQMIDNSAWVRQNLTPSQIKRALYQFYRTNYANLPGVPKLLNDAAKSVSF